MNEDVGHLENDGYYSYELIVYSEQQEVLWSGTVMARQTMGPGGIPALKLAEIPDELQDVLKNNVVARNEWQPAWDVVEDEKEVKQD
jgi:hypothetical protein